MIFDSLCDDIFGVDPKIRFVGIYERGDLHTKMREGMESFLTAEETKMAARQAFIRWKTREAYASKTGKPLFAIGVYEKMYRMTISFGVNSLILISTEKNAQPFEISDKVIELLKKHITVN